MLNCERHQYEMSNLLRIMLRTFFTPVVILKFLMKHSGVDVSMGDVRKLCKGWIEGPPASCRVVS